MPGRASARDACGMIYDDRPCALGEGPLWHPERQQLFWFDILGRRLLTRIGDTRGQWQFDDHVSAAGWVDADTLLIAAETGLDLFDLRRGTSDRLAPLEADNPVTRSNDGRADPWGGFWIGTMGKRAEAEAGAIWRYWRGEVRQLFAPLTIPNAISFTPDRRHAHFADSARGKVWRVALDPREGWPVGTPDLYLDLADDGLTPDGAVCDAKGNLWLALWGASRVACHAPDGSLVGTVRVGGRHASCPAFGGPDLRTLFVTSAREGLAPDMIAGAPSNGCTFACAVEAQGLAEHRVIL